MRVAEFTLLWNQGGRVPRISTLGAAGTFILQIKEGGVPFTIIPAERVAITAKVRKMGMPYYKTGEAVQALFQH